MHDPFEWPILGGDFEGLDDVGLAIAHMNDEWQARFLRQREMSLEIILLNLERAVIPVAVEAGFTQPDDTWLLSESSDLVPITRLHFVAVVRLDPDGGINRIILLGELNAALTCRACGAYGDHGADACLNGSLDDVISNRVKRVVIEMRMSIEPFHERDSM